MPKTNISVSVETKTPLDEVLIAQSLEKIARHFSASDLSKVARKLDNPLVMLKIKSML